MMVGIKKVLRWYFDRFKHRKWIRLQLRQLWKRANNIDDEKWVR